MDSSRAIKIIGTANISTGRIHDIKLCPLLIQMAIFENYVAITALVGVQKSLLSARHPLPVRIIGEDEDIFDATVDQVHAFNKIHLPRFAHFLKNTWRNNR